MIHRVLKSHKSKMGDGYTMYAIMKTMCPPGYCHNGFVATDELGHMMYGTSRTQVHELLQSHCGNNWKGRLFS